MLARLALVLHWGIYAVLAIEVIMTLYEIPSRAGVGSVIPLIVFVGIYRIVTKQWVIFPWEHVKPDEKLDADKNE